MIYIYIFNKIEHIYTERERKRQRQINTYLHIYFDIYIYIYIHLYIYIHIYTHLFLCKTRAMNKTPQHRQRCAKLGLLGRGPALAATAVFYS